MIRMTSNTHTHTCMHHDIQSRFEIVHSAQTPLGATHTLTHTFTAITRTPQTPHVTLFTPPNTQTTCDATGRETACARRWGPTFGPDKEVRVYCTRLGRVDARLGAKIQEERSIFGAPRSNRSPSTHYPWSRLGIAGNSPREEQGAHDLGQQDHALQGRHGSS